MIQAGHSSLSVYQNEGGIGKAPFQCGVVDILAGDRIGGIILNPGPGYIDLPPFSCQGLAVLGINILADVEGYDLDVRMLLRQQG